MQEAQIVLSDGEVNWVLLELDQVHNVRVEPLATQVLSR